MLILISPLLLVISLIIKLSDRGPVFFRQDRLGLDAKYFRIWKFRTMIVDADRYLDGEGKATRNRITPIGNILRRYSLDELPQLINVVTGEMSIVGPRPVLPSHFARYTDEQRGRFAMRPGITGLAQVSGRNELKWSKRIELDLKYIENFGLYRDLKILLDTVFLLVSSKVDTLDRNPDVVDDLGPPRPE